jgi:Tol biopolymer transport system component/DNA-binding winged helix-turn-helix (wHTH) protein
MPARRILEFGDFVLDPAERALFRGGAPVSLPPKDIETLIVLVEHAGHIVEKEELVERVWADVFVEESNVSKRIFNLRHVLGENGGGTPYIETIPRRGYRFTAPVKESQQAAAVSAPVPVAEAAPTPDITRGGPREADASRDPALKADRTIPSDSLSSQTLQQRQIGTRRSRLRRAWILLAVLSVLAFSTAATLAVWPRDNTPRVNRTTQITSLGRASDPLAVSGEQLFLGIRTGGSRQVAAISALASSSSAGDPLILPTGLSGAHVYDASPDGSQLLLGSESVAEEDRPLWIVGSAGGAPKRVGDLTGSGAAWSPDGQRIVYTHGSAVLIANVDGTDPRKLADVPGFAFWPRWSRDGKVIRFSVEDTNQQAAAIWEIASSGGSPRLLFPDLKDNEDRWGSGPAKGTWSQDGKYFYFLLGRQTSTGVSTSVWVMRDSVDFLGRRPSPKQIFISPLNLSAPIPSADGRRLFVTAFQNDRELMKFDARQQRFVSWLGGPSVSAVTNSPDRQWVAFVSFADGVLWRARADGRDAIKLVEFAYRSFGPAFSPDGKRIALYDAHEIHRRRIHIVPRDGGTPVPMTAGDDSSPSWFPDGNAILYRHQPPPGDQTSDPRGLYRLSLQTGEKTRIPASEEKTDPALSPDGLSVLAVSEDLRKLSLFNFRTGEWRDLASGVFLRSPCWSRDSRFIYFQDYYQGSEQPIYRVRLSDGHLEKVATSAQFQRSDVFHGYVFQGLAPDGSTVVSLVRNKSDVFALELDLPK